MPATPRGRGERAGFMTGLTIDGVGERPARRGEGTYTACRSAFLEVGTHAMGMPGMAGGGAPGGLGMPALAGVTHCMAPSITGFRGRGKAQAGRARGVHRHGQPYVIAPVRSVANGASVFSKPVLLPGQGGVGQGIPRLLQMRGAQHQRDRCLPTLANKTTVWISARSRVARRRRAGAPSSVAPRGAGRPLLRVDDGGAVRRRRHRERQRIQGRPRDVDTRRADAERASTTVRMSRNQGEVARGGAVAR